MMTWRRLLLPAGVDAAAGPLLVARALRAFGDGYMAVLLPAYLLAIGLGTLEVGVRQHRDDARLGAGHARRRRLGPSLAPGRCCAALRC